MIELGILQLLAAEPTLVAIQGDRVTPGALPEGSPLPAMVFMVVGGDSDPTFETSGLQMWRLQIDCFAKSYLEAFNLRKALIRFLNGWCGELPDGTRVENIDFIQPIDWFESVPKNHRLGSEFYVQFNLPA